MTAASWTRIVTAARADRAFLLAGRSLVSPELEPIMSRAIDLLDGKGEVRDAIAQGALSTLLLGRLREAFVAFWIEEGGAGFATACAAHERRFVAAHARKPSGLDLRVRYLALRAPEQVAIALDIPTREVLAPAFKRLKKSERALAQAEVRAARADLPLAITCYIDAIALLAEEAAHDILEAEKDEAQWNALHAQLITMLPALATDPSPKARAAAEAILRQHRVGLVNQIAPYVKAITDVLEDESTAMILARILRDAHGDGATDVASAQKVARALAEISHPLVEEFFSTHVGSRLVGKVAADYVASNQTRASATAQARAEAMHAQHLVEHAERSKRAKSAAKKRAAVREIAHVFEDAPVADATLEEIPWILLNPPWRGAVAPFPRAVFVAPPFEERVHWTEEEGREADEDDPVRTLVRDGAAAIDATIALCEDGFQALRRVESPRVAVAMLSALATKREPLALKYFADYPEATTIGLVELMMCGDGDARQILRALAHVIRTNASAVEKTLATCGDAIASIAAELVVAARLMDCPSEPFAIADFARPERLPVLVSRSGGKLSVDASLHLLEMLSFFEVAKPYAGAALVRDALDRVALDRFLVALVESAIRIDNEDDWPTLGLAALGGPDAMRAMIKQIKKWNQTYTTRDRALDALDAMALGGRDAAAALTELLRKGAGGQVGERAAHVLRVIARREGLSGDELADMSTPSLDLAPDGTVTLDFGPRTLRVVLGSDLSAVVLDEAGAQVKSVRAQKTDDPIKARASIDRFKSLKKALGETARGAAARLEQSMVVARTWDGSTFYDYVAHPLLGRIARRFIWARIDRATNGVLATFRVSEDGSFSDERDKAITVERDAHVRVVHPMEIDARVLNAWGGMFADYEIIQPFPQLGRTTFTPTREELVSNELDRFRGKPAKQMAIMGRLTTRGWEKVGDIAVFGYVKRVRGAAAHYVLAEPMLSGDEFKNDTTIGAVTFGAPLGKVSPIAFSEAAYDLHVFEE